MGYKYDANYSYFDRIDEPNKAYWLGFIEADGNITDERLLITLHKRDMNHLEKLADDLDATQPVKLRVDSKTGEKRHCYLSVWSVDLCESLKKSGIEKRKTKKGSLPVDSVPYEYREDFWRGMIDGDGFIMKHGERWRLGLVGTETACTRFKEYCQEIIPTKASVREHGNDSYKFAINGRYCKAVAGELYSTFARCMDRKKEKVDECLK